MHHHRLAAGLLAAAAVPLAGATAQAPAGPDSARPGAGAEARDSARADPSDRYERPRPFTLRRFRDEAGVPPGAGDVLLRFGGPDLRAERRSVIGVALDEADSLGLRVAQVAADGPAARAGLAAGDRLLAVNGQSLRLAPGDAGDPLLAAVPGRRLTRAVGRLVPGSEVELRYARDGRERVARLRTAAPEAVATVGPDGPIERFFGPGGPARDSTVRDDVRRLRARGDSLRARAAERPVLGLTLGGTGSARDTLGLFVRAIVTGGPAERAGVVEGDRVAALNDVDLRVPRDERDAPEAAAARRARFTRELARLRPGDRVTLRLAGGRPRTVTATVGRAAEVYRDGPGAFGFGELGPGAGAFGFFGGPAATRGQLGPGARVWRFRGPPAGPTRGHPRPAGPGIRIRARTITI
jgi:hypothetical protein